MPEKRERFIDERYIGERSSFNLDLDNAKGTQGLLEVLAWSSHLIQFVKLVSAPIFCYLCEPFPGLFLPCIFPKLVRVSRYVFSHAKVILQHGDELQTLTLHPTCSGW